jgi:hypothetical protein
MNDSCTEFSFADHVDLSWGLHKRSAVDADLLDLSWTEMDNLDEFSPCDSDSYLDLESELSGHERTTADTMNSSSDEDNDDGEDGEDAATVEEDEDDGATDRKRHRTQKCSASFTSLFF